MYRSYHAMLVPNRYDDTGGVSSIGLLNQPSYRMYRHRNMMIPVQIRYWNSEISIQYMVACHSTYKDCSAWSQYRAPFRSHDIFMNHDSLPCWPCDGLPICCTNVMKWKHGCEMKSQPCKDTLCTKRCLIVSSNHRSTCSLGIIPRDLYAILSTRSLPVTQFHI